MFRDVIKGDEQNPLFPHAEKVRVRVRPETPPRPRPLPHEDGVERENFLSVSSRR